MKPKIFDSYKVIGLCTHFSAITAGSFNWSKLSIQSIFWWSEPGSQRYELELHCQNGMLILDDLRSMWTDLESFDWLLQCLEWIHVNYHDLCVCYHVKICVGAGHEKKKEFFACQETYLLLFIPKIVHFFSPAIMAWQLHVSLTNLHCHEKL